jgi:hypothetical protein
VIAAVIRTLALLNAERGWSLGSGFESGVDEDAWATLVSTTQT